jgi:hypothetical protein
MISFLTGLPHWLLGMLIVGLPTVLAMFGPILVRRYATLEKLTENNEVAGFKFAVVGVLYAVLLGFAIIVVWERFSDAENNVTREAGAAATIYRLSQGINGQPGIALRCSASTSMSAKCQLLIPCIGLGVSNFVGWGTTLPSEKEGRPRGYGVRSLNYCGSRWLRASRSCVFCKSAGMAQCRELAILAS